MDKLTKNYNLCESLLKSKMLTIEELEFELSQLVVQCNEQDEDIYKLKKEKNEIQNDISLFKVKLHDVEEKYKKSVMKCNHIMKLKEETEKELETEKEGRQDDMLRYEAQIGELLIDKANKEKYINKLLLDKGSSNQSIKALISAKEKLEESLSTMCIKYKQEVQEMEKTISEFQIIIDDDKIREGSLTEKVEELERKFSTLEILHSKDIVENAKLGIEIASAKKVNDELKKNFNEYVQNNNQTKSMLVKEKKKLLEIIKLLREKSKQKDDENNSLKQRDIDNRNKFNEILNKYMNLKKENEKIVLKHVEELKELNNKNTALQDKNEFLIKKDKEYPKDYIDVKNAKKALEGQIEVLKNRITIQRKEKTKVETEKLDIQKKYDSINIKINEVLEELKQLKNEHQTYVKDKNKQISMYTAKIKKMEEEGEKLRIESSKTVNDNDWLIKNLKYTKFILEYEVTIKNNLKMKYLELIENQKRQELMDDEFEKINNKSNKIYHDIRYDYVQKMEERNKKLDYVNELLIVEKDRLSKLISLFPKSLTG